MLVVQASIMGEGGEVFILKMGSSIRIIEMARDLISMHGLRPDVDVKIQITGLRDGEKIHEDLVVEGEPIEDSTHDYILTARPQLPPGWNKSEVLQKLAAFALSGDGGAIRKYLATLIPDSNLTQG